ncbi:MAG: hypothetical protein NC548_05815 [Lachnospiraceae bacterium]|nr:hypothetical protein [Lachnospiraceae bacterium]
MVLVLVPSTTWFKHHREESANALSSHYFLGLKVQFDQHQHKDSPNNLRKLVKFIMANKPTAREKTVQRQIRSLDAVAHKLLSTLDPGFSERQLIDSKNRRISEILDNELSLSKGVANGSIVDFVVSMASNQVPHNRKNPILDDSSELFTKDVTSIFGYYQEMYKSRYVEMADLKFVAKFIPALGEAVRTTLDAIVGSDDMSATITRNLVFGSNLTDSEKAAVTAEIERIEREEKLPKKLRNTVYKKTLVSGQHYVYAPPYSALFQEYDRLVKAGKVQNGNIITAPNVASTKKHAKGFNLTAVSESIGEDTFDDIVQEAVDVGSITEALKATGNFSRDELNLMTKELETSGLSITTSQSPYLFEAIESIAALETYNDYSASLQGYVNTFDGLGVLYDENIAKTTNGVIDPTVKGSKFNTTGTYLKYIDASKLVPVKVYNRIVGYFHVHDTTASKKAKGIASGDSMMVNSINLFSNQNLMQTKKEDAVKTIVDTITDGILSNFSSRFVNNNAEHKKLIADCIIANGLINNNLQIQFIPAEHIVSFAIDEDEDNGGQSMLSDSLFPARLLLDLIISKMLLYMNKSGNKTLAFVRKGPIDVSYSNHIQRTLRQLQESNITFGDLLSSNLSFAKFAPYGALQIPTARNGDRLVDFEVQEGQQIDMKPEFEDWLEKMAIMGTGVPSVILEYTDAADYARSITSGNIKHATRVASFQTDLEEPTTQLYRILIANSNLPDELKTKVLPHFQYKLPRPRVLANANMGEYVSSMQQTAETMANITFGQNGQQDEEAQAVRDEYIKQVCIDHLPFIDWNANEALIERAKENVAKHKKLKDKTEGGGDESAFGADADALDSGDDVF